MHNRITYPFFCALFCLFSYVPLAAQEAVIWPGDASDNGKVNGIDMLYWAHAYGTKGEPRPDASSDWSAQQMGAPWNERYPDGHNFAYADADGDGRITGRDLILLFDHQHRTRASAQVDDDYVLPDSTGNHDATLRLLPAGVQLTAEGSQLLIDVEVRGRGDSIFRHFHGMTIRATLPAGVFADHADYENQSVEEALSGRAKWIRWLSVDSTQHQLNFTITSLDGSDRSVFEPISRIALPLADGLMASDLDSVRITVDSLLLVDAAFQSRPVFVSSMAINNDAGCSFTVSPVCGDNGVTYLNSCFAEAAGVTVYTPGACWNPGLSADAMDPDANCPLAYDPVCGFNGVTYTNACAAEAAGVSNYFSGLCNPTDLSCYDPSLIVISNGTSVNQATGVITLDCPTGDGPVCGCDGQQYPSACAAEAAGVRSYTSGNCDANCVDPTEITATDDCGTTTDFVCGCNGETYINACFADAAGVQSYTSGPCNGASGVISSPAILVPLAWRTSAQTGFTPSRRPPLEISK